MNFVREVVESKAAMDRENLMKELPLVLSESTTLKEATIRNIKTVYVDFETRPGIAPNLLEIKNLFDKYQNLEADYQSVLKVEVHATKHVVIVGRDKLDQIKTNLTVCRDLNFYYENLRTAKQLIEQEMFENAAQLISSFKSIKVTVPQYQFWFNLLQKEAKIIEYSLVTKLQSIYEKNFVYSIKENKDISVFYWNIKQGSKQVQQAIGALSCLGLDYFIFLQDLTDHIWKSIKAIVQHASKFEIKPEQYVITVKPKHKDTYAEVFNNLLEFTKYLSKSLGYMITDCYSNRQEIMDYIRGELQHDLIKLIINDCLENTLPTTDNQVEDYEQVILKTTTLQSGLIEYKLLENTNELVAFTFRVKKSLIQKTCQEFQRNAIGIMKNDLYKVTVTVPHNPKEVAFQDFSKCVISKSVLTLLSLIEELIIKETACNATSSGGYLTTACDILSQYHAVVSAYHQKELETIPQHMAIFYNNCKYIAHAFAAKVFNVDMIKLPPILMKHENFSLVSLHFNEMAVDVLLRLNSQESKHVKVKYNAQDTWEDAAQKLDVDVWNCLKHLQTLKAALEDILCTADFNSTIGMLLNCFIASIIACVIAISDKPKAVCEHFVNIINLVMKAGPALLTDPKEVRSCVASWDEFQETMLQLNLNLLQLKGSNCTESLASQFIADEKLHSDKN